MNRGVYLDQYRKNAVQTASPLQLVIMLYDGAIRFCTEGKSAIDSKDRFQQNEKLQRAQRIISELTSCLDMDKGGEIGNNLFNLYMFCYNELVDANMFDDTDKVDGVIKVLTDLRDGWVSLSQQLKEDQRLAS